MKKPTSPRPPSVPSHVPIPRPTTHTLASTAVLLLLSAMLPLLSPGAAAAQAFSIAPEPPPLHAPVLIPAMNNFAWDAYRQLAVQERSSFAFCPASLWIATGMLGIGSSGDTSAELLRALRLDDWAAIDTELAGLLAVLTADQQALNIASRIYLQQDLRLLPSYLDRLERSFKTGVEQVDFSASAAAAQTIDDFLANNGFHQPLGAAAVTPQTLMILANVVRARAVWDRPFPREATSPLTFHASGGPVELPFMHDTRYCRYAETDHTQLLELRGGQLSLWIVLPREGVSLPQLERHLTAQYLRTALAEQRLCEIHVRMPVFEVESQLEGQELFRGLGVQETFSPDADFSGMTGERALRVDRMLHVAALAVDEQGAEATAATVGELVLTKYSEPKTFLANRPFVFALARRSAPNDSGAPLSLFLGRYAP